LSRINLKGITLIDALVSLVILSLGFLMVLTVFPISGVFIKSSENRLLAKQVAQTYLEYYSCPANWWETSSATPGTIATNTEVVNIRINDARASTSFTWIAESEEYPGTDGELINLKVTVTWREQYLGKAQSLSGEIKQIELATIVVNPD